MEKVNIIYSGEGFQSQDLSIQDRQLIASNFINTAFGEADDYLELYIYDELGSLLEVDYDAFDYYPFLTANPKNNTYSNLVLDPEKDVKNRGYNRGTLKTQYNFYKKLFNSSANQNYWIKEISTSRTELKLASQVISNIGIRDGFTAYQDYANTKNYYPIFYLNFGNNQTVIATNVAYTEDDEGAYLLVKLYEPLPSDFDIKTQLWIVDKVAESVSFDIIIQVKAELIQQQNRLRGPNYNVVLNTKNGQTTPYYNYNNLLLSPVTSSFQKLLSYYQDKAIQINVDYCDFKNFIHFSSAVERINNFVYKLQLIEASNASIISQSAITGGGSIVSSSITAEQKAIDNIIKNFDTYEYFLYFESASWAWPKSTSTQPYSLYSTTSSQASNFLGGVNIVPTATTQSLLWSASYYDATNKDLLHNSIPQYLLDDPANQPYITFLDMIGQHFDNIWIYYKDVKNRYNATNNPNTGISLDMVSDALKGLGFQLYTNSNVSDNLYYTLFGINPDGSLLPPTGSEKITNYVTSSLTTLPAETIQDELYKRLYHNLPYLLKSKGTARGVKALVSIFGIPEEILTVREFGGNYTGSLDGIIDLNSSEYKVTIATGSGGNVTGGLTISSSLLSPYTTIQYYQGNTRLNNTNVEVGFSPADVINANISASQGIFSLDQLIGSPGYQYSASYTPLVSASNAYFASYNKPNSVWEYIRLLKFYNNTLFKTIKDFVPARANVSTGIIVKSHMYERNKYARNEPSVTFNDYSQSIDILEVSADNGGALSGSTAWSGFVVTPLGLASYSSSQNEELYNGELDGTLIVATNGLAMEQGDYISHTTGSINFYDYGALYQNISGSVRSQNFIDLDYNSDQMTPVNYGAVTYSLNELNTNAYSAYTNPNNPFAQLQDYNYNLQRSLIPRYVGSDTISATYNTYTTGDQSYGKTAAIDKIKYQYAYLIDIYTASAFLPGRSNAQIKYLIDNNENVLDLTKTNKNIFEVQNIFKSGESTDIALFEYDELNPYTQQLANNPTVAIYEGGWRYLPIYHNVNQSSPSHKFLLSTFPESTVIQGSGASPGDPAAQPSNYTATWWACETSEGGSGYSNYALYLVVSSSIGNVPYDVTVTVSYLTPSLLGCGATDGYNTRSRTVTILSGTSGIQTLTITTIRDVEQNGGANGCSECGGVFFPTNVECCETSITSVVGGSGGGGGASGGSSKFTFYQTDFSSSLTCLYFRSESNEIIFNTTMSYYYSSDFAPIIFSSSSDIDWAASGLSPVILPFQLSPGDRISLYNSQSLGWDEKFEYVIKSGPRYIGANPPTNVTSSVMAFELAVPDDGINLALFFSGSSTPTESISGAPFRTCRYVIWKHVPDETNVMLKYNPKSPTLVENGLLLPQYIDPVVRDNSGNVIKALKQQNLI
jgi:hypothetical protein